MDEQLLHDAHEVFCEVFQCDVPYETFRHKHLDNPERDSEFFVLCDYDAGIVRGITAFLKYILLYNGKKAFVVHPCDVAVSSKYRGQHIFTKIQHCGITACEQGNVALMFATPNENSYPGYLKLNFYELGKLDTCAAITRPAHLLCRKLLRKASALPLFQAASFTDSGGHAWQMSLRCPFTEQDIAVINDRPGIHLQRSRAFFQWKIDYLPEGETAYLFTRQNNKLLAYFVLRRHSGGTCEICDWMVPEEQRLSVQILKTVVRFLRRYCDLITVPMINPTGAEPALLPSGGFFRKKAPPQPFLIYPTSDALTEDELTQLKDLTNWTLRSIDGDTILNG